MVHNSYSIFVCLSIFYCYIHRCIGCFVLCIFSCCLRSELFFIDFNFAFEVFWSCTWVYHILYHLFSFLVFLILSFDDQVYFQLCLWVFLIWLIVFEFVALLMLLIIFPLPSLTFLLLVIWGTIWLIFLMIFLIMEIWVMGVPLHILIPIFVLIVCFVSIHLWSDL